MHRREELTIEKFLKLNYATTLIISFFFLSLTNTSSIALSFPTYTYYSHVFGNYCLFLSLLDSTSTVYHHIPPPLIPEASSFSSFFFPPSPLSYFFHPPLHLIRELHPSVTEQMISYLLSSFCEQHTLIRKYTLVGLLLHVILSFSFEKGKERREPK